jgi:cell division protein FtsA
MTFNSGMSLRRPSRSEVIAALDVGTTKVCCLVARVSRGGATHIIGLGHQVSRGLRAGAIVDLDAAKQAIGAAVHSAEEMARETIREVLVNVSGGQPKSLLTNVEVPIAGHEVRDGDVRRALTHARQIQGGADQELIHSIAVGYAIDGTRGILDPRGMVGRKLGVQIHSVIAGASAVRDLATCLARCHLDVEGFVLSPYSAGLATLVEDEMELGCTLIDMGGGTTTISVFIEGKCHFMDVVPLGGCHVTSDIARGLTTPPHHAERLKTLHGSALARADDEREFIEVPVEGDYEPAQVNHVPLAYLVGIIQPRLEEIFEVVRARLEAAGMYKPAGRRIVLTGGACQIPGTRDLAQLVLDKHVRIGKPLRLSGLADAVAGPAFATAAGLLSFAAQDRAKP